MLLLIFKETELTEYFWTKHGALLLLWWFSAAAVCFVSDAWSEAIFFPELSLTSAAVGA